MAKSVKHKHKQPRAGIALYQAAMKNPTDYLGFLRLVHLRKLAVENPEFCKSLNSIWQPVRKTTDLITQASGRVRPLMEQVITEYGAQLCLIYADIDRQGQKEKAALEKLIKEVQHATIRADEEWAKLFDCPRPKTCEDWQRLAVRAGLSADFVFKGQWIPEDVLPIIEGYLQRFKDQQPVLQTVEPAKSAVRSKQKEIPKRPWTRHELELAIQQYKATHSAQLQQFLGILGNKKSTAMEKRSARRAAQRIFGRNAITRALGVKSARLVGETTTWKSLVALLGLRSKTTSIARHILREELVKSNTAVTMESRPVHSYAAVDTELMDAEREETLRCIREFSQSHKKDAKEAARSIYEKYKKNEMTDDQVRETIALLSKGRF
jgi:hypothetical protein